MNPRIERFVAGEGGASAIELALGAAVYGSTGLRCEQLSECGLGPLDAAGQYGLLSDERPDEEVRIG